MKITKEHKIVYLVIIGLFILFGFTIKFPLFAFASDKHSLFQSSSIMEIFLIFVGITGLYILCIYFVPFNDIAEQIKSLREPILKLQNAKFEYWLKSELYEHELNEQMHLEIMDGYENRRQSEKLDVLKKAAELSDMEVETYIKALQIQANANYINAKSEKEKAEADILKKAIPIMPKMPPMWQAYVISCITKVPHEITHDLELQKEIDKIVKDKHAEELRKSVIENDNLEEKYKRNKQAAQ